LEPQEVLAEEVTDLTLLERMYLEAEEVELRFEGAERTLSLQAVEVEPVEASVDVQEAVEQEEA
jgi:hypothetical protein